MPAEPASVLTALGLPGAADAHRMPGFEASVWRVDLTDGSTVAVRVLRPDRSSARELEALRLAALHTTAAPRVLAAGTVDGQAAIVTTWCAGTPIGDLLASGGDPGVLGVAFGRAHAELHRGLDATDDATDEALCHNDFQPFNVLAQDGKVTGIVDWSMGALGDRRTDLAWTTVMLALGPAVYPHLAPVTEQFAAAWRTGYSAIAPFPSEDELHPFVFAAARRQSAEWRERADLGECPPAVADAADAVIVQHST